MKAPARPIYALGDLHGNLDAFRDICRSLGLCDDRLRWTGRSCIVVQIGDICDRGGDSRSIYDALMAWQREAPAHESEVHVLVGNHEVMNMFGSDHYATEEEKAGYKSHGAAFGKGGDVHEWLLRQRAIMHIGPAIFAHADLPPALAATPIDRIDDIVMEALGRHTPPRGTAASFFPPVLFSEEESILWCREAQKGGESYGQHLRSFLELHGASMYICGHTPDDRGRLTVKWGASYICIDTGMAFERHGFGGRSALSIDDGVTAHYFRKGKHITAKIR